MKKRRGRPFKQTTDKPRAQLTILVRHKIKRMIELSALANGRTQSAEAEHWLERLIIYDNLFPRMSDALRVRSAEASAFERMRTALERKERSAFERMRTALDPKERPGLERIKEAMALLREVVGEDDQVKES